MTEHNENMTESNNTINLTKTTIKGLKVAYDLSEFKSTGRVIATLQLNAGKHIRYNFTQVGGVVDEDGNLHFPDGFTPDSFVDCEVYIPFSKETIPVSSDAVFHTLMSRAFYEHYYKEHVECHEHVNQSN